MRKIQLVDLDGCTADDRWRRGYILPEPPEGRDSPEWGRRFNPYHARSYLDKPMNRGELLPGVEQVILTARPVAWASATKWWVEGTLGLRPVAILHRGNTDHRSSVEIKRTQLGWLLDPNNCYGVRAEMIVDAIDDRADIVAMYREVLGFGRIVRIGEEEHACG